MIKDMKLEAKHLAPYLPYNLQVEYKGKATTLDALDTTGGAFVGENRMVSFVNQRHIKPILRHLSSITIEEVKEFSMLALLDFIGDDSALLNLDIKTDKVSGTTINCSFSEIMFNYIHTATTYSICVCGDFIKIADKETGKSISVSYSLYEWLFEHHFDVFGLIDKGLAIEKK